MRARKISADDQKMRVLPVRTAAACIVVAVISWTTSLSTPVSAQVPPDAIEPPAWPRSIEMYPAPEPFNVNGYDAMQAVALIRRAGLLIRRTGRSREIVAVRSVEAVETDRAETMPELHRRRFDVLLNGEPLEWSTHYVEYGGRMVNLQILFTYRNQRPVPSAPFYLE